MIWISHRGNLRGPNPKEENSTEQIENALACGFNVEIDVWWKDGRFHLGHDEPRYPITKYYLKHPLFWCHAKNIEALYEMLSVGGIHCFFHDKDAAVLTSKGYIWTYPGQKLFGRSIAVLPEKNQEITWHTSAGICSDIIEILQEQNHDLGS